MLTDAAVSRTAGHGGQDRPGPAPRPVRAWPLVVLALPAAVAVWSGWVGIGEMTGFGVVRPLPGIWDSFQLNTAVTLPVGVEAYAAMALRAWLASSGLVSEGTRRFAKWSAIGALLLGIAGQVAYHLLAEAHTTRAPWLVTTLVASLPVVVLGLGTALAHMLRADACVTDQRRDAGSGAVLPGPEPGPGGLGPVAGSGAWSGVADQARNEGPEHDGAMRTRLREVQAVADSLTAAGQRVSRRSLRAAGVRGSNTELAELAKRVRAGNPVGRSAVRA